MRVAANQACSPPAAAQRGGAQRDGGQQRPAQHTPERPEGARVISRELLRMCCVYMIQETGRHVSNSPFGARVLYLSACTIPCSVDCAYGPLRSSVPLAILLYLLCLLYWLYSLRWPTRP